MGLTTVSAPRPPVWVVSNPPATQTRLLDLRSQKEVRFTFRLLLDTQFFCVCPQREHLPYRVSSASVKTRGFPSLVLSLGVPVAERPKNKVSVPLSVPA